MSWFSVPAFDGYLMHRNFGVKGGGGVIERVRFVSGVLAVLFADVAAAVALGAAGCSSDNAQFAAPGSGSAGRGGAGSPSVGPSGGNGVGGAAGSSAGGTGGGIVGGTGGGVVGGATGTGDQGQPGCPSPSGPAGTWVEVAPPPGQTDFHVTDAFAVGADDLLFAGNTFNPAGLAPPADARVLRWNQGCWTVEVMISPSTSAPEFPSVHGTGPNDLWATGGDLLFQRDAQGWSRFADESWRGTIRLPPNSPTTLRPVQLRRVRAAAAGDVWVAEASNMMHWNGQWTTYNFDDPGYPDVGASVGFGYDDIWIDGPNNVWVVGSADQVGNTMEPGAAHHFNGASWTHFAIGVFEIFGIWREGAVLWLAEPTLADLNGQTVSATLRAFDGTNASAPAVVIAGFDPTQRSVAMTSLFGRGAADMWAAGDDIAHFDGQGWSLVQDAPAPAHGTNNDFRNTFVTGDAGAVWLVTPGPRFFRKATGP